MAAFLAIIAAAAAAAAAYFYLRRSSSHAVQSLAVLPFVNTGGKSKSKVENRWVLLAQSTTGQETFLSGGSRIRTHGELAPPAVFKTAALNHSAIPPNRTAETRENAGSH